MMELHGTKVSVSRDGVQQVHRIYYVDSLDDVDNVPATGAGINGRAIALVGVMADQAEEGSQFIVTALYEGMAGKSMSHKSYGWRREDSAEPIINNPNFPAIVKRYGGQKMQGSLDYEWPEIKLRKGVMMNPMVGVDSFLSLGGEWQEAEVVEKIPSDLFHGMWTLVDSVPGELPTPAGRMWLVMPPNVDPRGACNVITRSWKLTGVMSAAKLELARMIYTPTEG